MLSCNLTKTILNKWFQQLGNCGNDLYVATMDDLSKCSHKYQGIINISKVNLQGPDQGRETNATYYSMLGPEV